MGGTVNGGKLAAKTNKELYGSDFYAKIGAKGGKLGRKGGFAANIECDKPFCEFGGSHYVKQCAGAKGGSKSRRNKVAA